MCYPFVCFVDVRNHHKSIISGETGGGIAQETHAALFLIPRSHDSINNTLHVEVRIENIQDSTCRMAKPERERAAEPSST